MWELITQSQWVPGPGTTTAETLKFLNRFTPAQSGNWFCNIFHFSGVYFCLQKPFCPTGKWHKTSWDIVVLTSNFSLTISYKLPSLSILWLLLYIVVKALPLLVFSKRCSIFLCTLNVLTQSHWKTIIECKINKIWKVF